MIVANYQIAPGGTVDMAVDLQERGGLVLIYLKGDAQMPCLCGRGHLMNFEAELGCGPEMGKQDMDDIEAAIRGDDEAAQRLGWRLLLMLFQREKPPCQAKSHLTSPK